MKQYNGIAIAGPIGAGKDTLGRFLSRYGLGKVMNIAEGIYKEVADRNGVTVQEVYNNKAQYRLELQDVGASYIKTDPLHWILKMRSKKTRPGYDLEKTPRCQRPIITDMRYLHEYAYFKGLGFFMIYITAPSEVLEARTPAPADTRLHGSEQELRGFKSCYWDYIVNNEGERAELAHEVENVDEAISEGM